MTPEQDRIIRAATNRYLQAKATADLMERHLRELHQMAELGISQDATVARPEPPEAVESEQDEAI